MDKAGYSPEVTEAPKDTLFCFLDGDRVCSAECMAYLTNPRIAKDVELIAAQTHCSLLLSAERLARHVTIIAATLDGMRKQKKLALADEQRVANTPAVNPFPVMPK